MVRKRNRNIGLFLIIALVSALLANPGAAFAAATPAGAAEKTATEMQDENFEVRQKLQQDANSVLLSSLTKPEATAIKGITPALNFRLAAANQDGSFTTIADYATFAEAEAAMENSANANAVVQDLTRTVGNGVVDMKDGIAVIAAEKTGKSTLTMGYTYVNNGNDAYFYSSTGSAVDLGISGYDAAGISADNLELIPRVQAAGQSHYSVNTSGYLVHSLAAYKLDMASNSYKGTYSSFNMGKAPAFMAEGIKYYSMDGYTFFTTPQLDAAAGTFYIYYKYLTLRSRTSYTAEELDSYIASWNKPTSVLNGKGQAFIDAQNTYGVNAMLLLCISAHESAYGTSTLAVQRNNLFGINAIDSDPGQADYFTTVEDCIGYAADRIISQGYTDAKTDFRYFGAHIGNKKSGMNVKYASDPYWGEKIAAHAERLDQYLGIKDGNKYQLAFSNAVVNAKLQPDMASATVYKLANGSNNYPANIPVLVVQSANGWYRIQSDMPMDAAGNADYSYRYDYSLSKAYVRTIDFTVLNDPAVKYVDPAAEGSVLRLSGSDRYATSVAISKAGWSKANTVIIATGLNYPDALAASALTKSKDAPILLAGKNGLEQCVVEEIKRLKATQAVLVGGDDVVGTGVEAQLTDIGVSFTRISGTDRYDTSAKVAGMIGTGSGIILATGLNFPDALSIAPIAAIKSMPILLSPKASLDPSVSAFIAGKSIPVSYILGGSDVLSDSVAASLPNSRRLSGDDRYATNMSIINEFAGDLNFDTVYIATGLNFPDALSGSALAAKKNAPIILAGKDTISQEAIDLIKSKGVNNIVIIGGADVVSQNVEAALADAIASN